MTNDHLLNLLSYLFLSFPPKRCDTISPRPHLLSVTSRQLGRKLNRIRLIIPDNLSGISVVGLSSEMWDNLSHISSNVLS